MSTFSGNEISYLPAERLGRLATVGGDGTPHVVPVGYRLTEGQDAVEIGGIDKCPAPGVRRRFPAVSQGDAAFSDAAHTLEYGPDPRPYLAGDTTREILAVLLARGLAASK